MSRFGEKKKQKRDHKEELSVGWNNVKMNLTNFEGLSRNIPIFFRIRTSD